MLTAALSAVGSAEEPLVVFEPQPTDAVLFNPGMGLYLQHPPTDAKPKEWFLQIADIAYYRFDWSEVNPAPSKYRFEEVFGRLFDFWVRARGKRVAFRVMSENPNSKSRYVTPAWVFERGVRSVRHRATYAGGHEQICPAFWDPLYLDLHCEFIRAMGRYLDGRPGLEFVDIGSIGVWGEMHFGSGDHGWTQADFDETDYTEAKLILAYRRVIDTFCEAFPKTRIFLNVGGKDRQTINEYAASRGVHFRQDGLSPTGGSYDCGEWLFKPYARRGVLCNFEFLATWEGMRGRGWDPAAALRKGLEAPISYLNTNLFFGEGYRKAPPEAIKLLTEAARRVGYRFVLARVEHPAALRVSAGRRSRLPLRSSWRNDGVAPASESYAIRWSLLDASGKESLSELAFPAVPTTQWWPGESYQADATLSVPERLRPGRYRLAVAMGLPDGGDGIALGIEGRDSKGRYLLGAIEVTRDAAAAPKGGAARAAFEQDFETDGPPWRAAEGISVAVDEKAAHGGRKSLLVSGSAAEAWSYVSLRLEEKLHQGARYKLSAWMLVEKIDPVSRPPLLKLGVRDGSGKFLRNFTSEAYDTKRLGTWQKLEVAADLPPGAASGEIAVEKGDNTTRVAIELRLDDVRLELLEGR